MISRAIKAALENQSDSSLHTCPREDSFADMYASLGNPDELEQIRLAHPDKAHCHFLRADCNACARMPEMDGVPADYVGEACFNNPYIRRDPVEQKRVDRALRLGKMLNEANVLLDACRLGLIKSLDHLQAGEFVAVRHVLHWEINKKLELQMRAGLAGLAGTELM